MPLRLLRTNPRRRNPDYSSMSQEQLVKEYLRGFEHYQSLAQKARSALRDLDESPGYETDEVLRGEFLKAQAEAKKAADAYSAIFPLLTPETKMKYLTAKVAARRNNPRPRRNPDQLKWVLVETIRVLNTVERIYGLENGDRDTYYLEGNPVPMIEVGRKLLVVQARDEEYMGRNRFDGHIAEARDGVPYRTTPMFSTDGASLEEVKSKLVAEVKKLQQAAE